MTILLIVFFIILGLIILLSLHNAIFGSEAYKEKTIVLCMVVVLGIGIALLIL